MAARAQIGPLGEDFWCNSRGCVKVSLGGESPFVDRQSMNASPGGSGGGVFWNLVAVHRDAGRKRVERSGPGTVVICP